MSNMSSLLAYCALKFLEIFFIIALLPFYINIVIQACLCASVLLHLHDRNLTLPATSYIIFFN